MTAEKTAIRTTYFSMAGNTILAIVKAIAGIFGNSFALIADALESTTDIFSSALVWLGIKYSNKPADENHPYGHGRAEPLITFLVVVFSVASAIFIAYESIRNILTPHESPRPFTLIILGTIIAWKEISYRIVLKRSRQTNSLALKADAWHHRGDAITSVAAFIGISIAVIAGKGYEAADDWAALFASLLILYNSYRIFRPALGEIMDEHMYDDVIANIRQVALMVEGVVATEKCFIRKSGMKYHVDLHATVDADISVRQGHLISHELKDILRQKIPQLGHVLIHIEPDRE